MIFLEAFDKTQSVKTTAKEVGCGWQRVLKILSSNGIFVNDVHATILELYANGKTAEERTKQIGYSLKTVQVYIPAKRPYYNVNPSDNAKRIKHCREKKAIIISTILCMSFPVLPMVVRAGEVRRLLKILGNVR